MGDGVGFFAQLRKAARNRLSEHTPGLLSLVAPLVWCRYRIVAPLRLDPRDRRLCVFAHFDGEDLIEDYVVHHLEQLYRAGVDVIFVTTCRPSAGDFARIAPLCAAIIERENVGIDFGSWRTALLAYPQVMRSRLLLFINDSVYGPLHPLGPILDAMEDADCDFFGISESLELQSHYQSYFLGFKPACLQSAIFDRFVRNIELLRDKTTVIEQYEVALKGRLEAGGLRGTALIRVENDPADNPMHLRWRELLRGGAPYLKIELLRDNPHGLPIDDWPDVVRSHGYEPALIARHLRRQGARSR